MTTKALWAQIRDAKSPVVMKPRHRIRPRTSARASQESKYRRMVKSWLLMPQNRICAVCIRTGENVLKLATECHHSHGRVGALLLMQEFWLPVCQMHHQHITAYPNWARARGFICELGQWNTVPKGKL